MIAGRDRVVNVIAAVDAVRDVHPELHAKLTGARLWRILEREGVLVRREPIRQKARVSGFDGDYIITLRSGLPPREAWRYALHEYAHVKLHMHARGEHVRNLSPCRRGDPREDEANLFGLLLVLGPEESIEHPDATRIAGRIVARAVRARRPMQLPLGLPRSPASSEHPCPNPPAADVDRRESARGFIRRTTNERAKAPLRWSTIGRGCSHEALRFDWSRDGKPLRFFDYELGWLEVSDFRRFARPDGKSRIQQLTCGDSRTEVRVFVVSSKDQRRYRFGEKERRHRGVKELERQLRGASPIKAPATTPEAKRSAPTRSNV